MEADFLILADAAEVAGDKVYMLGGAWSAIHCHQGMPVVHPLALVAGILVGWMETNRSHTFRVEVRNEDTNDVIYFAEGQFETGRPPGIPAGMTQRFPIALKVAPKFDVAGQYVARLIVNDEELKRAPFLVIDHTARR
ncbi:MAG: DUF6941 family protein [Dehalococcoidia bacterium]